MFKNLDEVVEVVDSGLPVYWKNEAYLVIKDNLGSYLVNCQANGHCCGLFWSDGVNSDYNADDFYTETDKPLCQLRAQGLIELTENGN